MSFHVQKPTLIVESYPPPQCTVPGMHQWAQTAFDPFKYLPLVAESILVSLLRMVREQAEDKASVGPNKTDKYHECTILASTEIRWVPLASFQARMFSPARDRSCWG